MSEDDDPVVSEVDVFLSKQLANNLILMQYPVRPASMPYEEGCHLSAKIKPRQQRIQMEVAMNTRSPNYATSKGEQIAVNTDGGERTYYHSGQMDKQVLQSTPSGLSTGRYVIGALKGGELHLTPLSGIVQIRPSFDYMDKSEQNQKDSGGGGDAGESSQDEEEAKAVTVKFARHETEDAKARRMASFEYMRKQQAEEPWVKVEHHHINDPLSEIERGMLFSRQNSEVTQFQLTPEEYLQKLIPQPEETEETKPKLPSNVLSMTELKTMCLSDQIRALLINAKVIRFSQLMSLLPKGTDTTNALRCLQQVALLVQGCWVVKSELLYPKDSLSAFSGVAGEILCRGRDYIMWRFTQSRYLVRKDITSVIKLPAEDVKDVLEQMAALKVSRGWEFLMEYDSEFVHRHPDVTQRQHMLWEAKFQQLSKVLNISKADLKLAANAAAAAASLSPKRRRTVSRSRTKSGGDQSMSDLSDTDSRTSERQRHASGGRRRRNSSGPGGGRRQRLTSGGSDIVPMETNNHGDGGASNASSVAMDTMSPPVRIQQEPDVAMTTVTREPVDEAELKKTLVSFVYEKLSSRYVLSSRDLRQLLTLKLTELPAGHILGTGVSDKMLEQAVYDVGGVRYSQLNHQGDPLFIFIKFGDAFDAIRGTMLDLYETKPILKLNVLRKKIEEAGLTLPPDTELKKMMKDYSYSKGGSWHLKNFSADS